MNTEGLTPKEIYDRKKNRLNAFKLHTANPERRNSIRVETAMKGKSQAEKKKLL
jgi:hypothetical protein